MIYRFCNYKLYIRYRYSGKSLDGRGTHVQCKWRPIGSWIGFTRVQWALCFHRPTGARRSVSLGSAGLNYMQVQKKLVWILDQPGESLKSEKRERNTGITVYWGNTACVSMHMRVSGFKTSACTRATSGTALALAHARCRYAVREKNQFTFPTIRPTLSQNKLHVFVVNAPKCFVGWSSAPDLAGELTMLPYCRGILISPVTFDPAFEALLVVQWCSNVRFFT